MLGLFIALGISILTLVVILLWFVPHLLQQQAKQAANESAQLRDMLFDVLSEQEIATQRQGQLGTSVYRLQEKMEKMTGGRNHEFVAEYATQRLMDPDVRELRELKQRVQSMQAEIETFMQSAQTRNTQDNESWAYLLSLLSAVMDRIGELSNESSTPPIALSVNNNHEHRCH